VNALPQQMEPTARFRRGVAGTRLRPAPAEPAPPALRLLEGGVRGAGSFDRFVAHALEWLSTQIGADVAAYSPVDERLAAFTSDPVIVKFADPALRLRACEAHRAYVRLHHATDLFAPRRWASTGATVVSVRDVGGEAAFAGSRHAEYLGLYGLGAQASVYLRQDDRIVATIALLRAAGKPHFDPRAIGLLRRTQPFLEHAHLLARRPASVAPAAAALDGHGLTPREAEVARLAAGGATNAEIARALCVTVATVKTHVVHVLAKLGVRTRTELVLRLDADRCVLDGAGEP
jgi:DNA-binding CsgD family transcriptional regulator